jgi:hypothetical protein
MRYPNRIRPVALIRDSASVDAAGGVCAEAAYAVAMSTSVPITIEP